MNETYEDFDEKRRHLIAEIAHQRGELAQAYRNLEKPIHYAEYGLRGFGFLRKNPWVLTVVPALFNVSSTVIGLVRNQPGKGGLPFSKQRQKIERERPKGIVGHAVRLGGHGWKLFRLYRRLRHYLPLP